MHEAARPYVPRALLEHLAAELDGAVRAVDGTCVFVDVSGFTSLSERLARRGGREGAEQLADAIGGCFEELLGVAYDKGGGLLKFGGDALLLLFDGEAHLERACSSAIAMNGRLRELGPVATGAAKVTLRMSAGVHSGEHLLFAVGGSHRELLIAGPAASEVVRMEKQAAAGEIVVSAATAAALPRSCLGPARGAGRILRAPPRIVRTFAAPLPETIDATHAPAALSTELRAHVLAGPQPPEHRIVCVAFLRFDGTDELVAARGPSAAADALDALVRLVQDAADAEQVCFLGSDIDADGGKLILTAGAPRALGDEEERMLLALRRIVDAGPPLPLRIGVTHGPLFAGDIGPRYRRTYTVMGDVVNLAARLMASAAPGAIYATPLVLERSSTRFETTALEPLRVKGKALPVEAVAVGPVVRGGGAAARGPVPVRFPLVGRDRELDRIAGALDDARRGRGRLIELVSEPGMGRSRLMEEVRDRAGGVRLLQATCEPYTATTPYATWRDPLRRLIGATADDADRVVLARLRATLERDDPALLTWLPLLADAFDVEAPASAKVAQLASEFRAARLREVVLRFMRRQLAGWSLIELADAHLMDAASAELLEALARELPLLPWLVVVSRRDRDTGFTAVPAEHVLHLDLGPLGPDDTLALAEAATETAPLPPHLVALAAERSGGSPQFLRDLLRAAVAGSSELPDSIESAALARLDRIAPPDRALIRRAAVLGLHFHPRHLDDLLDDDVPPPDRDTWARLGAYFKEEPDGSLRFRREVVRDVAYAGLPFRVRRELHAAAAGRLEGDLGADADEAAARLAVHYHRAGAHAKAWHYARLAADRARERAAFADAAELYRRALETVHQLDVEPGELAFVWESLADAYVRTGELERADHALNAARRLVAGDPVRTAHLLWLHARIAERGQVPRAVRWANRALRTLDGVDDAAAAACRAHVIVTLAAVRQRQGRTSEAVRLARRAITEAEAAHEELALGQAYHTLDWALVMTGRAAEAHYSERALDIFRRHGAVDRESGVLNNMGAYAYRAGRWDEAVALYRSSGDASERAGDVNFRAFTDCNVGELLSDQGRLEEAESLLRRALQVWRGTADEHGVAFATTLLGRLHARAGDTEGAVQLLEDALARFEALRVEVDAALVKTLLAEAALFDGRAEEAHERAHALLDETPEDTLLEPLLRHLKGVALAQMGETAAAVEAIAGALDAARAAELPLETAFALDALEQLAAPGADGRARELDQLVERLDIARLPRPPLARPRKAAAAAG